MQKLQWLGVLAVLSVLNTGCASILQGSRQRVSIVTEPAAASIQVDGLKIGESPVTTSLKRGKTHLLKISKDGYEDKTFVANSSASGGWVVLDVLCGLVPLVVDIATSNWEKFESPMYMTLQKLGSEHDSSLVGDRSGAIGDPGSGSTAQVGELVLADKSRTEAFADSGYVNCKISMGWSSTTAALDFEGPVLVGDKPLGPFTKTHIATYPGAVFYVRSDRGDVFRVNVDSVRSKGVTLEWVRL
jgi:hypothetical protein